MPADIAFGDQDDVGQFARVQSFAIASASGARPLTLRSVSVSSMTSVVTSDWELKTRHSRAFRWFSSSGTTLAYHAGIDKDHGDDFSP